MLCGFAEMLGVSVGFHVVVAFLVVHDLVCVLIFFIVLVTRA